MTLFLCWFCRFLFCLRTSSRHRNKLLGTLGVVSNTLLSPRQVSSTSRFCLRQCDKHVDTRQLNRATGPIDLWEMVQPGLCSDQSLDSGTGTTTSARSRQDLSGLQSSVCRRTWTRSHCDGLRSLLFGSFGLCYGLALRLIEWQLLELNHWHRYRCYSSAATCLS